MERWVSEARTIPVRVSSLNDIARFAASLASLGQPVYIIRFKRGEKTVYGLLAVFRDFYKYYGLPIFYYIEVDGEHDDKNYLVVRADEHGERVELSKTTRIGAISIPIITLDEIPPFIGLS